MLQKNYLHKEVYEYIASGRGDRDELVREIFNFQIKSIKIYGEYHKRLKESGDKEELSFLPVEAFKKEILFLGEPEGYFLSSGTSGERSKVFYNKNSLELYRISSLRNFPFKNAQVFSLIPSFDKAKHSSLSFMLKVFEEELGLVFLETSSFELDYKRAFEEVQRNLSSGDVLFLTSTQLYFIVKENRKKEFDKKIKIVETGGYKKLKKKYSRKRLYTYSKSVFYNASFFSEYGMAEMFSQFYTDDEGYLIGDNPMVFTRGKGLLKVFDFANLYTVSALLVPDLIMVRNDHFEILRRITGEVRGCGYVFS